MVYWRPRQRLANFELQRGLGMLEGGMTRTQVADDLGSTRALSAGQ